MHSLLIGVPALAALAAGQSGGSAQFDAAGGAIESAWAALSSMAALAAAAVAHVRGAVRDRQKEFANVQGRLGKFAKKVRESLIAPPWSCWPGRCCSSPSRRSASSSRSTARTTAWS